MDPSLRFLPNGLVVCCLCAEAVTRDQLEPVSAEPGKL